MLQYSFRYMDAIIIQKFGKLQKSMILKDLGNVLKVDMHYLLFLSQLDHGTDKMHGLKIKVLIVYC